MCSARFSRIRAAGFVLVTVFLLALTSLATRPAEAAPTTFSLVPYVGAQYSSVVVNERQTATNTGTFDDTLDDDNDTVKITASVGSVTQSGSEDGTWSWSLATSDVSDDQTKNVTITARDSTGRYRSTTFSLTVKNVDPPPNDPFTGATHLDASYWYALSGNTSLATMEAGEPRPYSPSKDCGIYGVSNSVWFRVTMPSNWPADRAVNFYTSGSSFDTVLALYSGSSLDTLRQVDCSNDNSSPNRNDTLSIAPGTLSAGATYYLQLTGTEGARSGSYRLGLESCVPPYPGANWCYN